MMATALFGQTCKMFCRNRVRLVSDHPETFFRQNSDEGPYLRVGDILLRYRHSHTCLFSDLIRFATKSKWSHSSLVFLEPDPAQSSEAIFLVDVTTKEGRVRRKLVA
ncbi:MAG TPA: hypothetical protein VKV40_05475 [Ktedonobacteraceae bacterium]|nr:hypothetical protein [Ktedonobacteraceae bacterium]